ncbi:hypothetical protein B0H14DRAFT_3756324 [Mycena olivaceomarginata]|nr:hypothetical protein B0H14DRAFT_3756324 [Mycena olivaceomarginata]
MDGHLSRSASHKGLLHDADEITRPTSASEGYEEPLVGSAMLRRSRKGIFHVYVCSETVTDPSGAGWTTFTVKSTKSLRLLALCFHSTLVVIHVALIPVWFKKLENRLVFALKYQSSVSFFITAVTQTFGTVCGFFLTLGSFFHQYGTGLSRSAGSRDAKLSMRRSLVTAQPLTATHDSTAAWAGIGSAFIQLWHQKAVRASITGIISVSLYLGTILVLHITTPGLFSLETFNSTSISVVLTEGLPAMNMSVYNGTTDEDLHDYFIRLPAQNYIAGSLYYLPYVDGSTNIGLTGGTLYDVPQTNAAVGPITVEATGFNVTCMCLEDLTADFARENSQWIVSTGQVYLAPLESTQPRIISATMPYNTRNPIFYSTIPIIYSDNSTGGLVRLDPPMNSTAIVSSIQLFQCFLSLVEQTAVLDAESKKMVALHPQIVKNTSAWHPGNSNQTLPTTRNALFDYVGLCLSCCGLLIWFSGGLWYSGMPTSEFPRDPMGSGAVTLHDLENALSELVATMFWTSRAHRSDISSRGVRHSTAILHATVRHSTIREVENTVMLLSGRDTTATEQSIKIRLNISIGLVSSVALMLLSLQNSLLPAHHENEEDLPIDGTGLLHAIWLYRNHPELELLWNKSHVRPIIICARREWCERDSWGPALAKQRAGRNQNITVHGVLASLDDRSIRFIFFMPTRARGKRVIEWRKMDSW